MKVSYQGNVKKKHPLLGQLEDGSVFCFANYVDKTPYILIEGNALDDIYTDRFSTIEDYIVGADYDGNLSMSDFRPILAMNGELFFTSRLNDVISLNATMVIEGEE